MVAGCRFWGGNEEQRAQYQPRERGDLAIETISQDGGRSGEPGRLFAGVEPGREIDQEDDRETEKADGEDEVAEPPATAEPCGAGECAGEKGEGNQEVGMRLPRRFDFHGRRRGRGEARVAGLADLDRVVGDELRGDQAAGGDDDDHAGRLLRREELTRPGRQGGGAADRAPDAPFARREAAEHQAQNWTQCSTGALLHFPGLHQERFHPRPEPCPHPPCSGADPFGAPRYPPIGADKQAVAPSIRALRPPLGGWRSGLRQQPIAEAIRPLGPSSGRGR